MYILLIIIGLALILAGANYLTDGAAALAQRLKMPEFVIGLTIVAVGTSTPELVVSAMSAINGSSDIAIGNVVGSNLFNIFIILGICTLITPLALSGSTIRRDIPIGVAASLILLAALSDSYLGISEINKIGRLEGVIMLIIYFALMAYTIRLARKEQSNEEQPKEKLMPLWLSLVMIVGGLGGLVYGGNLFVDNAILLAQRLGVSESVIAITLVAGGTSLPELASSIVSLVKGKADMALGNVVGSNIANILLILGSCATITPLTLGGITIVDILMVLLGSLLLFVSAFTFQRKAIDRYEGVIFLIIYVVYIWYLIQR
ncbi:MAG: calcium/sodium antiporter [Alistipes sp.]|nr:calcium/sodium antiporter [Alistipes sp.]